MSDDESRGPLMEVRTGLPVLTDEEMEKKKCGAIGTICGLLIVPRIIGLAIVLLVVFYATGMKTYDARLVALNSMGTSGVATLDFELGYLYIAIGIISVFVSFANVYPMIYKEQVLPQNSGDLRANMMIYKVNFVDTNNGYGEPLKKFPYVVMEDDGEIGEYNRANRALFHWNEYGIAVALNVFAAGLIFSLPVMVLTIIYVIARIWYQIAYAAGGYGMGCCKHAIPFMISTVLIAPIIEMAVFFAGGRLLWLNA